jgi:hypothetical protein
MGWNPTPKQVFKLLTLMHHNSRGISVLICVWRNPVLRCEATLINPRDTYVFPPINQFPKGEQ